MDIQKLYDIIITELENETINKFESKERFLNWNQVLFENRGFKSYGLSVSEIDKIVKKNLNKFKELSFEDRIKLTRIFYKSEYIAQTSFGLKLLEISLSELKPQKFKILDEICGYLTYWGPTDSFSLNVMQPLLKKHSPDVKQLLEQWNNSDHTWKKRVSVVTFTRKIGAEGIYVDFVLKLCNNLIWEKEDLVRKAVGWALKDNMIGKNKKKVLDYVKELRRKGVSSIITLYAIRNLKGKEREEVLKIKPEK
ncbi:MAG: DNA alkylation repair protein [Promethearchaeota archaeon]